MAMKNPEGGRRAQRAELEALMRLIPINHGSPLLEVKIAPRKVRRTKDYFRPIYGYRGARLDTPHKEVIKAMKTMEVR